MLLRQVLLAHHHRDAEGADHAHADEGRATAAERAADGDEDARSAAAVATRLASSTGRRPSRSASGPATSVPTPPASSISESRWLP